LYLSSRGLARWAFQRRSRNAASRARGLHVLFGRQPPAWAANQNRKSLIGIPRGDVPFLVVRDPHRNLGGLVVLQTQNRYPVGLQYGPQPLARVQQALEQLESVFGSLTLQCGPLAAVNSMPRIQGLEIEPSPAGSDAHELRPDRGDDVFTCCQPGVFGGLLACIEHTHPRNDLDRGALLAQQALFVHDRKYRGVDFFVHSEGSRRVVTPSSMP